jgi:glycosyltransferase involved in cell wall biosynthesis
MDLVVMIPAYNEEKTIGAVVKEIPSAIEGIAKIEVLVINDGSTDATAEVARDAGATKVVNHDVNLGLAKAFMTGIRTALEMKADIIVNTDADMQYDQRQISQLVGPIVKGEASVVLGSRFEGYIEEMTLRKKMGNRLATYATRLFSGFRTTDAQSGFRAYSREAASELKVRGNKTYVQETIIRPARLGFKIIEIPITFRKRDGQSRLIKSLWGYAIRVLPYMLLCYIDAIRARRHLPRNRY